MKSKNFSTVTELTAKIKDLMENNFFNVFVKGEIGKKDGLTYLNI